jgi:hypothetical protein
MIETHKKFQGEIIMSVKMMPASFVWEPLAKDQLD